MTAARLSTGQPVILGRKLAEGGEGRIHEIDGAPDRLAKLYLKPIDDAMKRKLVAMVQLRSAELEAVAAWPIDLLHDESNRCTGFVMPKITGPGVIDKLSHPAEQRIAFPKVDFGFLVHVAMNLMRGAATLHAAGCIVGDVNQSNVYVLTDGTIRFIDVDSFQVTHRGELFACNVGTSLFTPPELQGVTFRGTPRTPNHDAFGLAVLVFELLIQGCHPYAHTPRDGRARTLEEAISEGLYPHSTQRRHLALPPPGRLPPAALGELNGLFERSFLEAQRPSPTEWMHALDRIRGRLRRCGRNPRHAFLQDLVSCPLCELLRDPLPHHGDDHARPVDLGGLSIAELIRQAGDLPALRTLAQRTSESGIPASERTVPAAPKNMPQGQPVAASNQAAGYGITAVLFIIAGVVLLGNAPPAGLGCLGLGIVLSVVSGVKATDESNKREAAAADLTARQQAAMAAYEPLRREAQGALERLVSLEERTRSLDGSAAGMLRPLATTANSHREWLSGSTGRLQTALNYADSEYRTHVLTEYLEKQIIAKATIPGIGPSRKAVLASFGIETAADVERQAVQSIAGFGPNLTDRLLAWRRSCEHNFPHRGSLKAPADWLERTRQQHQSTVMTTAGKLRDTLTEYRRMHGVLDRQLAAATIELDTARRACRTHLSALHR